MNTVCFVCPGKGSRKCDECDRITCTDHIQYIENIESNYCDKCFEYREQQLNKPLKMNRGPSIPTHILLNGSKWLNAIRDLVRIGKIKAESSSGVDVMSMLGSIINKLNPDLFPKDDWYTQYLLLCRDDPEKSLEYHKQVNRSLVWIK